MVATLKTTVIQEPSSSTANLTLDAVGNSISGGTVVMTSPFTMRNKIINGAMQVWQRGTTYALTTSIAYGSADRWAALQATTANGVLSQVASGLTGFQYALKLGRNSAATTTGILEIAQALETVNSIDLASQSVTLSFWAKAGANFSATSSLITVQLASGTGTDQSVSAQVGGSWTGVTYPINTTQTITTSWVRYSFTGSMPSTTTQAGVQIYYTPTGTAGADDNLYITGVQLERGTVATPFEYRNYQQELAMCQRYYEVFGPDGVGTLIVAGIATSASQNAWSVFPYKVTKRTAPTATIVGSWSFTNATGLGISVAGVAETRISVNSSAAGQFYVYANLTSTYITLNSEL